MKENELVSMENKKIQEIKYKIKSEMEDYERTFEEYKDDPNVATFY